MSLDDDIAAAAREAEQFAETDPTYAELMGTYAELGRRLRDARTAADVEDITDLVGRTIALGRRADAEFCQRLAVGAARNTRSRRNAA